VPVDTFGVQKEYITPRPSGRREGGPPGLMAHSVLGFVLRWVPAFFPLEKGVFWVLPSCFSYNFSSRGRGFLRLCFIRMLQVTSCFPVFSFERFGFLKESWIV
jgi:hypothetical protein